MSDKVLNIEISGTNYKLTDQERSYVEKKCRKLVNHMPMLVVVQHSPVLRSLKLIKSRKQ